MLAGPQHAKRLVDQQIRGRHAQGGIVPELRFHPVGMIEPCESPAFFRKGCDCIGFLDRQFRGHIGKRGFSRWAGIGSGSGSV